jgi:hypothetical protein
MSISMDNSPSQSSAPIGLTAERSFGRIANWTVGALSAVLVLISVVGYLYHREQLSEIAAEHLRLIVTGPSAIQAGVAAEYTISTGAISGQPLPAQIEVDILGSDGKRLKACKESADEHGRLRVAIPADLRLPPQITLTVVATYQKSREETTLAIQVAPAREGNAPCPTSSRSASATVSPDAKESPVVVRFYPEGGFLVPGVENRIYFTAHDAAGKPIAMTATLLAKEQGGKAKEEDVEVVQTSSEGRGVFSLIPRKNEAYRLKITSPKDVKVEPLLPAVDRDRNIELSAGSGIFAAGKPLEFNLRASRSGVPLVAAVYCCGMQVGQQPLVTKTGATNANPVVIALDDAVAGVLRLAVFDYSTTPPTLTGDRFIYRRPKQVLRLQMLQSQKLLQYAPNEKVDLGVTVTNEKGEPSPATLTASLTDAASPPPGESAAARSLLTSRLPQTNGTTSPDFCLQETAKAKKEDESGSVALDWLLAVQPLASNAMMPPLMFDNLNQIRSNYEKSMTDYQAGRTKTLNTLTTASFYGGLGLLLLVAMLGLMRIVTGIHLWIPTIGATTCCLIVGAILLDPSRLATMQDVSVAFSSYCESRLPESSLPKDADKGHETATNRETADLKTADDSKMKPFWQASIAVGADGRANLQIPLPAIPAKFRFTLNAENAGRFGADQVEIVSRQKKK